MKRLLVLLALAGCASLDLGQPLGAELRDGPALPLVRQWEQEAGAAFGPSAAIVSEQVVLVGTRQGDLVAFDRQTGRSLGSVSLGQSVEGQVALSATGAVVYVPLAEAGGGVVAYDVVASAVRWRWRERAVQGGVVAIGGQVIAAALNGTTVGLDADTGTLAWTRASPVGVQIQAAPVALGRSVVVADDRGEVVRLDAATGAELWSSSIGQPVFATPTVAGDVFVTTTRGRVARLAAETGREVWAAEAGATVRSSPPAVSAQAVVVGFSDGTVRSFDRESGAERWRFRTDGAVLGQPAVLDGHVAVGTMDQRLVLLDAQTGREVWAAQLRGRVKSAIGVGGGLLVVLSEPRHVVAFHAAP